MDKYDKIESKLDKLDERLDTLSGTLIKNTESLQEHMRRTDLLEEKLVPVEEHVSFMKNGFKAVGWFCGAIAGVAGFLYILKSLNVF